jgi:hypothetical protein
MIFIKRNTGVLPVDLNTVSCTIELSVNEMINIPYEHILQVSIIYFIEFSRKLEIIIFIT